MFGRGDAAAARRMLKHALDLGEQGSDREMIALCDELLARFRESGDPKIRRIVVATGLERATALVRLGRSEDAIAGFDRVIARYAGEEDPEILGLVYVGEAKKAGALEDLRRWEEAIALYHAILARYDATGAVWYEAAAARASTGLAGAYLGARRFRESVLAADRGLRRLGRMAVPAAESETAICLLVKGEALGRLGHRRKEQQVYESIVGRFGASIDPPVSAAVASSLLRAAEALGRDCRWDEALAAFDRVLEWLGSRAFDSWNDVLAGIGHQARVGRASTLCKLKRWEQALAAADLALGKLGRSTSPGLRELRVDAQSWRGVALGELGRWSDGLAAHDLAMASLAGSGRPDNLRMAFVMADRAEALAQLARREEALAACDEFERLVAEVRPDAVTDPKRLEAAFALAREQVARARGLAMAKRKRRLPIPGRD